MEKIKVHKDLSGIQGLCLIEPKILTDNRGYLFEAYNRKEFHSKGLITEFIQDNEASSRKGVLRGFGINIKNPQAKLVRVLSGLIFDVVIDLRKESDTFMKWFGIKLSSENHKQLYIPEGFAHAYLALEDAVVLFKVSTHHVSGDEIGFAWDSEIFNISWPTDGIDEIILSNTDRDNHKFEISMVR